MLSERLFAQRRLSMKSPHFTAHQASKALGITLPSLYAYVSRGLIRSEATVGSKRTRRYRAEDVHVLKQRKDLRRNPAKIVEGALHWGEPVMESAITLIAAGHVYYLGHNVVSLSTNRTIEEVAALIWTGDFAPAAELFGTKATLPPRCLAMRKQLRELTTVEGFQVIVPLAAADDLAACDLRPTSVAQAGARIVRLLAAFAAKDRTHGKNIAQTLQEAWVPAKPQAAQLINTALILCADHELNVSSFAARCVASAGSSPYAVVTAGLAALQGIKHGRTSERIEALLQEARTPGGVRKAMIARLKRGERIPGFGHPLYPDGDPRGQELLALVAKIFPKSPAVAFAAAGAEEALKLIGERPSVDFGLVIAARALGLPPDGAITLFAIGRTVGWIGHAIEQYRRDRIIRPRARYVGETPVQA
jgi:citrate synthase